MKRGQRKPGMGYRIITTVVVTLGLVFGASTVAQATPPGPAADAATQRVLRDNPGATLTADGTIRLSRYVQLLPPSDEARVFHDGATVNADCPYYHLCLYQHRDFGGWGIAFESCRYFNLYNYAFPPIDGATWANRTTSLINNQTPGVVSGLGDSQFTPTVYLRQHAYGYRMNLALDPYPGGGNWNEAIDIIKVC